MELTQKQSQKLSMTAAMRQSLELLQLPVCELAARLQDAALSNPLLEVELPAPETLPAGPGTAVREAFRCLLTACVTYSMVLWLLVQMFPRMFVLIFNSNPALVDYAAWALRIYMGATGIFGVQIACQQTFVALGNAKTSLFLAILRKIILLIPLIYLLPCFFADKAFAVFLAEPMADLLAVLTTATLFARQFRRSMAELEAK